MNLTADEHVELLSAWRITRAFYAELAHDPRITAHQPQHFAVPLFDADHEPVEPYRCQRCREPICRHPVIGDTQRVYFIHQDQR